MTKSVKNTEPEDMHDAVVDVEDPIPIALSTNINHQIMLSAASLSQLQGVYLPNMLHVCLSHYLSAYKIMTIICKIRSFDYMHLLECRQCRSFVSVQKKENNPNVVQPIL